MPNANAHGAAATNGGQQPPKPVTIAFVLYPGFTALDIIGPFQVLASVPGHEAVFVAAEPGPVTDDTGRCQLIASASLEQMAAPDVVVIGGTLFNKEPDHEVVQWLRQVHPATSWTTSVCTGAIYLAAAGILDAKDATTHWARADELDRRGARYTEQRVVERGKGDHRRGRVRRYRHGSHPSRPHARPPTRSGRSACHRIRPLPAVRHRFTFQGLSGARGVRAVAAEHARRARASKQKLMPSSPAIGSMAPSMRVAACPVPPAPGPCFVLLPITSLPSVITCTSPGRSSARRTARPRPAVMLGGFMRRTRSVPGGRGCQKEIVARQIRQSSRSERSAVVRRWAFRARPAGGTGVCGRARGARPNGMTACDARRDSSSSTLRTTRRALRRTVMARPGLDVLAVASFMVRDGVDARSCP